MVARYVPDHGTPGVFPCCLTTVSWLHWCDAAAEAAPPYLHSYLHSYLHLHAWTIPNYCVQAAAPRTEQAAPGMSLAQERAVLLRGESAQDLEVQTAEGESISIAKDELADASAAQGEVSVHLQASQAAAELVLSAAILHATAL